MSFDVYKQLISDFFGIDVNQIEREKSLINDFGIDSLSIINFIVKIEKTYNIKYKIENIWELKNIGEAYDILVKNIEK